MNSNVKTFVIINEIDIESRETAAIVQGKGNPSLSKVAFSEWWVSTEGRKFRKFFPGGLKRSFEPSKADGFAHFLVTRKDFTYRTFEEICITA